MARGRKMKPVRHWLIQKRHDSGLTFKEIGKRVGVTPQCLYWWEIGKRTPSPSKAKIIAAVLNFEWTKFYEDNSTKEDTSIEERDG